MFSRGHNVQLRSLVAPSLRPAIPMPQEPHIPQGDTQPQPRTSTARGCCRAGTNTEEPTKRHHCRLGTSKGLTLTLRGFLSQVPSSNVANWCHPPQGHPSTSFGYPAAMGVPPAPSAPLSLAPSPSPACGGDSDHGWGPAGWPQREAACQQPQVGHSPSPPLDFIHEA